jgi:hypothetical protein
MQTLSVVSKQMPKTTIQQTLQSLDSAAADTSLATLSGLDIPQVRALKYELAQIFPASNLPGFLLQGLLQLKGRKLDAERVALDLRVLFRETRQLSLYGTFLAAPAVIIHGYQTLLTLAGKDLKSAFPHGTWQFYTEFGLREDAARHAVETRGFSEFAHTLNDIDAATCWVAAAIYTLYAYEDLLANEWYERVALRCVDLALNEAAIAQLGRKLPRKAEERERAIAEVVGELRERYGLSQLASDWAMRRPFAGPAGDMIEGYPRSRRRSFENYLHRRLSELPDSLRTRMQELLHERMQTELPEFQSQMNLCQTLRADQYSDVREPLSPLELQVGLIVGGIYHLIDVWERDSHGHVVITPRGSSPSDPGQSIPLIEHSPGNWTDRYGQPVTINRRGDVWIAGMHIGRLRCLPLERIHAQVATIMRQHRPISVGELEPNQLTDMLLASAFRGKQETLRGLLSATTREELEILRSAPILVNWDIQEPHLPLGQVRRVQRGVGDHAITIIRAGDRVIFDMSHIFFDGIWGAILTEIVTSFAVALGEQVRQMTPGRAKIAKPLRLSASPAFLKAARNREMHAPIEADAETTAVSINTINRLRRRLAERDLHMTVNDVLLLGRYFHAATYQPGPVAMAALNDLEARGGEATRLHAQIIRALEEQRDLVPSILIPMDASWIDPRQRLHPATLRNPQPELLPRLTRCYELLRQLTTDPKHQIKEQFEKERINLWLDLVRFSNLLRSLRDLTMRGESFATGALRLLGHLPRPMQNLMDQIPQKIDILNEIVKGSEVFSNIGQAPRSSTLGRFMSSRDDGDTKLLVWGVMTTGNGQLVISLRDFRPHVGMLHEAGFGVVAEVLVADFLDSYAQGINTLVKRIQKIFSYK